MRIIILGADGYVGWPLAMYLATLGHEVVAIDNYLRREITKISGSNTMFDNPDLSVRSKLFLEETGLNIHVEIGDITNINFVADLIKRIRPKAIVHAAEQPSAAYSMQGRDEAKNILTNNIEVTFNTIWGVIQYAPDCHLIKIGSIGEYGIPDVAIENGWLKLSDKDKKPQKFLFPREGESIYHVSKSMSSQLLLFYSRKYGLRCSNLMQGIIYGMQTPQTTLNEKLMPNLYYDCVFGNVINRFMAQSIVGLPLTVYNSGPQFRCYQNLIDTLKCIEYSVDNPARKGEVKIHNQYSEIYSAIDIANKVQKAAGEMDISVSISSDEHFKEERQANNYEIKKTQFADMGILPTLLNSELLISELKIIQKYKDNILLNRLTMQIAN